MKSKYRLIQVEYGDKECFYIIQKRKILGGWKYISEWTYLPDALSEFYRITGYKSQDDKVIIGC